MPPQPPKGWERVAEALADYLEERRRSARVPEGEGKP
jgi:hypothetical protein